MKLFTRRRRAKRLEKELGTGLWRQAHDRYVRGLDRFHQILDGVEDDEVHNQLVVIGDELADRLPLVYSLCQQAHQRYPATEMRVPAGAQMLHSALSRAANHLATTAEAEAMLRLNHGTIEAVRHRADQVLQNLNEAEAALGGKTREM
ncbi:hypothetical protein [Nesterenkonia sp.]|uniref:hypothetical protein n=1 Tax=Nesterenkonia sp. TaxID=704201 RepID=UPI002617CB5D|nr:hypothetical protein [Nesterenkonia sp.]